MTHLAFQALPVALGVGLAVVSLAVFEYVNSLTDIFFELVYGSSYYLGTVSSRTFFQIPTLAIVRPTLLAAQQYHHHLFV